jgi:putative transposase
MANRLPALKRELPWLPEADEQVLQQSLRNLARAFQNFFERRAAYPRFKSRHGPQSIQYPQRVKLNGNLIYLPKVGWVQAVIHRKIIGKIKTITVSKNPCGRYYASVLTDDGKPMPQPVMPEGGKFTGLDLGLTDFVVTGKGQHFPNPHHLVKAEQNLRRKQRKLSRKQKGSKRRNKARLKVARAHERVKNARNDFLHKLSRKLVDENQALAFEDLHVKGMMKNPNLARAISSAGWGTFTRFCEYKAARDAKFCVKTNRFYPSSKTCSECGKIRDVLPLNIRVWTCDGCGSVHDRDGNAAKNIGLEADWIFMAGFITTSGTGVAASGGRVRHAWRRKPSLRAAA